MGLFTKNVSRHEPYKNRNGRASKRFANELSPDKLFCEKFHPTFMVVGSTCSLCVTACVRAAA